MIKKLIRSLY
uniref:Uncharacterized protein n=1 Tax=Anguilla anguilla TaxID=7936 RepID=A0A0E9RVG0_ANGAN